jgi:site-specific DNA-methyltransferase (adenine-specific)
MIKLYKGDCLIESDKIESGSVDLILTDLPYGNMNGLNYKVFNNPSKDNGGMKWDNILPTDKVMEVANRILRKNGKMLLFAQQPFTTDLINAQIPNLPHSYNMIWEKTDFANCLLVNKSCVSFYEDILLFAKKDDPKDKNPAREYFYKERQKIKETLTEINKVAFGDTKGKDGMAGNILSPFKKNWSFPTKERYEQLNRAYGICKEPYPEILKLNKKYESTFNLLEGKKYKSNILKYKKDYDGYHPTQKPVLLLEDLIKTFSNEGDLVVDLTMGSGSTMVACKNNNRNGIGIEMNNEYFSIAEKRVEKNIITTGKQTSILDELN